MNISAPPTRFRWVICALLFAAAAINYVDRQVIGILKPTLQAEFQFDERAYAAIREMLLPHLIISNFALPW